MELAAAAGSAATVIQLVDFAARTIKSTTSFFASVVSASKELEILHLRVKHLEQLFENARVLACSYQNTTLALEPQNQRTLDLLGHALTKCSVDLQELNCILQKPIAQTEWAVVRMKRRVKHVLDETSLRRLSERLKENIISLNSLLSAISMHNDSVIHGSIQRVAGMVQHIPQLSAQLLDLRQQTTDPIFTRLDRIDNLLNKLDLADTEIATIASRDGVGKSKTSCQATEYASSSFNAIGRFEVTGVPANELFPALELFTPAFRTGMQFLYENKEIQVSKEAMSWILCEFHELLAEAHSAAARSYSHIITDEEGFESGFGEALIPRRFYRKTDIQQKIKWSLRDKPLATLTSGPKFDDSKLYTDGEGSVTTNSGQLLARFEGKHSSQEWPLGDSESGFLSISFIPKSTPNLPGIAIGFYKQPKGSDEIWHSFLTTFNVLFSDAPILRAIQDGDRGVSKVLQMLKSGEYWAGDRDHAGRSLLSYAIESGSRDMCALLFRMGALPQDSHSFKQMQSAPMRHIWS